MSIHPGDLYVYKSSYRNTEENVVIVSLLTEDPHDDGWNMWRIFTVDTGEYDQEFQHELLRRDGCYRRLA